MGALTLDWGTDAGAPGMPGPHELEAAINHICADIGAGADALVVDYAATYPGPEELGATVRALRDLVYPDWLDDVYVTEDWRDYAIFWDYYGDGLVSNEVNPGVGMPGPEELRTVLLAVHTRAGA